MYIPKAFRIEDPQHIEAFLKDNPFAVLITADDGHIHATHLPILRFKNKRLYGHMAKANPQADIEENALSRPDSQVRMHTSIYPILTFRPGTTAPFIAGAASSLLKNPQKSGLYSKRWSNY